MITFELLIQPQPFSLGNTNHMGCTSKHCSKALPASVQSCASFLVGQYFFFCYRLHIPIYCASENLRILCEVYYSMENTHSFVQVIIIFPCTLKYFHIVQLVIHQLLFSLETKVRKLMLASKHMLPVQQELRFKINTLRRLQKCI